MKTQMRHQVLRELCLGAALAAFVLVPSGGARAQATCSVEYVLPADVPGDSVQELTDAEFMVFAWQHFLALNAPAVGGQINLNGDNATQWSQWSSTADLLNQTNPGPSGSRYYPQACQQVSGYQNYRVLQQVGKVDDSFLEAKVGGLSDDPVIDSAGNFLRYEILLSPAMYNDILAQNLNQASVVAEQTNGVSLSCGNETYTGGDPANTQMGSIALKLAWRDASGVPPDWLAANAVHTEDMLVYTPSYRNSSGVESCEMKTMALLGMHIAHKTVKQPNWIWATFEHVMNAPDCTTLPPTVNTREVNTSCPNNTTLGSLAPVDCADDPACAACNTPPAQNGAGICMNPYDTSGESDGWCLDLPPNPVGGISRLCRQIPVSVGRGYCSNNPAMACDIGGTDCGDSGQCLVAYAGANDQNTACWNAIATAGNATQNGTSTWSNYQLVSSQWVAAVDSECRNNASLVWPPPKGPVNTANLRELIPLGVDSSGNPTDERPWLGNTSMESYDRSNCLGCHARSYTSGNVNTDFMYFLNLEVAEAPSLKLTNGKLKWEVKMPGGQGGKATAKLKLSLKDDHVLPGQVESANDPRCNGDSPLTVKAELRVSRGGEILADGVIPLPCGNWSVKRNDQRERQGPRPRGLKWPENQGDAAGQHDFRYSDPKRSDGPCQSVVINGGRGISLHCKGDTLPGDLGGPEGGAVGSLQISLITGRLRYCVEFSELQSVSKGQNLKVTAVSDPRPEVCPSL